MLKCGLLFQKKIGQGGYGSVYPVKDGKDKLWALKIPTGRLAYSEIDILSRFEHPHLTCAKMIQKSDDCKIDSVGFLMELSLGDLSDHPKVHSFDLLFEQCGSGLAFLHSQSVVHGDFRADNILVYQDGFKISDFGISGYCGPKEALSRGLTGPKNYMAPESYTQLQTSQKTDVWMFGILCLEYLLGDWWSFVAKKRYPQLQKKSERYMIEHRIPQLLLQDYKFDQRRIVEACLRPNPHDRPDMKDFIPSISGIVYTVDYTNTNAIGPLIKFLSKHKKEDAQVLFLCVNMFYKTSIKQSEYASLYKFAKEVIDATQVKKISAFSMRMIKQLKGVLNNDEVYEKCATGKQLALTFQKVILKGLYTQVDMDAWVNKIGNDGSSKRITIMEL
jgi:serine/threonine protein kinase